MITLTLVVHHLLDRLPEPEPLEAPTELDCLAVGQHNPHKPHQPLMVPPVPQARVEPTPLAQRPARNVTGQHLVKHPQNQLFGRLHGVDHGIADVVGHVEVVEDRPPHRPVHFLHGGVKFADVALAHGLESVDGEHSRVDINGCLHLFLLLGPCGVGL